MNEQDSDTRQFLSFILGDETYAFNILKIKEVLEVPHITKMPKSRVYMAGVINLRGNIVPVVDLRKKFGFENIELTQNTSIIIVEVEYDEELIMVGALVDAVRKVIKINPADLEPPPRVGMSIDVNLIKALGKIQDRLVIILNSDKLFSREELSRVSEEAQSLGAEDKRKNHHGRAVEEEIHVS